MVQEIPKGIECDFENNYCKVTEAELDLTIYQVTFNLTESIQNEDIDGTLQNVISK